MLRLAPPTLTFSRERPPFHDGMNEEAASFQFVCPVCAQPEARNVFSAIAAGETWYRSLSQGAQYAVAEVFGFSFNTEGPRELPYARMPNGRHVYFTMEQCPNCGGKSVIAFDFYEMQPARYIGVLQGVAQCLAEPNRSGGEGAA